MTFLDFRIKRFSFGWGWYKGSPFTLFKIMIFEKCDPSWITLLNIQALYFEISLMVDRGD